MKKYTYEISFAEKEEREALQKIEALTVLGSKLTAKELQRLKQVVLNEPAKLALAKKALGV